MLQSQYFLSVARPAPALHEVTCRTGESCARRCHCFIFSFRIEDGEKDGAPLEPSVLVAPTQAKGLRVYGHQALYGRSDYIDFGVESGLTLHVLENMHNHVF